MSSPISRASAWRISSARAFRSTARGAATCLREKARSCRVTSRDRCAAREISSALSRHALPSGIASRMSSASPRITVSMLLKSWATPPARRPTDSIFWAWRSCAWSRSFSSAAVLRPLTSRTTARTHPAPPMRVGWTVASAQKALPSFRVDTHSNDCSPSLTRHVRAMRSAAGAQSSSTVSASSSARVQRKTACAARFASRILPSAALATRIPSLVASKISR